MTMTENRFIVDPDDLTVEQPSGSRSVTFSRDEPLDLRVGPHGYSHGWVKGSDVLDGSWKLTGIQHDKGQCDHCGRDLGKVFQVVHPSGRTANLGSTHAAKATGFNKVQQAADAAAALAEKQKQRVATEQKLRAGGAGDLIDQLQSMPQTVDVGGSTMASSAQVVLNQLLDGILTPDQVRENMPNASDRSAGVIISRDEPLSLRNWAKWNEEHPYLHKGYHHKTETPEEHDRDLQRHFAESAHHFQTGRAQAYAETKDRLAAGGSVSLAKTEAEHHETKAVSYQGIVGRSKPENRSEVVRAVALHAGRAEGMKAAIDEHEHPAPALPELPKPSVDKPVDSRPNAPESGKTPADDSKYRPGSPKYKAFNEGHAQATTKAHSEALSADEARARAEFQRGEVSRLPTAKGDTRKANAEGLVAGYEAHAGKVGTSAAPQPKPEPPAAPKPSVDKPTTPPPTPKPTVSKPAAPSVPSAPAGSDSVRPADVQEQTYREAMASDRTSEQLAQDAYDARLAGRAARMAQGYGSMEEARHLARQKGLDRASLDKAKAEVATHSDLKPKSGWRKLTPDQTHQHVKDAMVVNGVGARSAEAEATRLSTTHESHLMHDGSLVHFNNSTKVSPAKKAITLKAVEDLRAKNPNQPPLEAFMGSGRAGYGGRAPRRFGKNVRGYAVKGSPQIWVAPATMKPAETANHEYAAAKGHFMPAGKGADPVRYVLAHEYGHTIDEKGSPGSVRTNTAVEQALRPNGSPTFNEDMSTYGKTTASESYAEAYAEWFMSDGQTTNPTVRKIAAAAGWSK